MDDQAFVAWMDDHPLWTLLVLCLAWLYTRWEWLCRR